MYEIQAHHTRRRNCCIQNNQVQQLTTFPFGLMRVLCLCVSACLFGPQIQNIAKMQNTPGVSKSQVEDFIRTGNTIFNRLEQGPKPIVAALNGTALGGGCELALIASHRVATPNVKIGLPELSLGIIPGLGGTRTFSLLAHAG